MDKKKKILLVLATIALTIGCIIAFELSERFARSKNEAETTTEKQTTVVTTVSESVTEEVSETTPSVQEMEETESVPVINIEIMNRSES